MSTAAFVERARSITEILVNAEIAQGRKEPEARQKIAQRVGCAPGTLWNLLRRRKKTVDEGFIAKLHADNVRRLYEDLARAYNEMEMAIQIGVSPASPEMAKLASSAKKIIALIEEAHSP